MEPTAPHRRFNPLLREWVLVSPQRLTRPWQGRVEPAAPSTVPAYDPSCYLCPGNTRAGNAKNPVYTGTFVFDNDYPALLPDATAAAAGLDEGNGLLVARPERGICRVVCFSPRHDASLASLSAGELRQVVDVWTDQFVTLGALPEIAHVQIFENRGEAMGASNPHPHGQIWANATVPDLPSREGAAQDAHRAEHGSCLLCTYFAAERARGERIVCANERFTAIVPFWGVWPFETLVLPARHVTGLDELTGEERSALAAILRRLTQTYDALFENPCPYSMGFHQRPTDGAAHPAWHLHAHFLPRVLRSATVHKFMVGYELLAMPQRDTTAEYAAAMLREVARSTT